MASASNSSSSSNNGGPGGSINNSTAGGANSAAAAVARLSLIPAGGADNDATSLLTRDFSLGSITTAASVASASSQQDEFYKTRDHAERTLQHMQNYLDNQQLCDVTLVAGCDGKK